MKNIASIKNLCQDAGITEGKTSDEYLFTICAVDLFYYKGNIGKVDILTGFTDGSNDGGIDFIFSDDETMFLIQGKSSSNLSVDEIKNVFSKMRDTVNDYETHDFDKYNSALKSAFKTAFDSINDDKNIEFVLFTNTPLDEAKRNLISEYENSPGMSSYRIHAYDKTDIDLKEASLTQGSELVEDGFVIIARNETNNNNCLAYGENGIIVNVKASSIKNLYDKHRKSGALFSYNLRDHIVQKNVDDGIDATINSEKENFWFYNNGITIGCVDFRIDGYKVHLHKFSIINGAQTTTKIGESKVVNENNDFLLTCKIVKAPNNQDDQDIQDSFISKISEASNSQKPIKPRDLKANTKDQKLLQHRSQSNHYPLSIEIKRGVRPKNYKKVEKWQRVTNEYVGQLIYACLFQKPGPARNSSTTLFSSTKIYNQVFVRKHDYDTIYDLVRLGDVYDSFLSDYADKFEFDSLSLAKNGKLCVLAICIYFLKKHKGLVTDATSPGIYKDNIAGLLVSDYPDDDLEEKLYELFGFIIKILKDLYDAKKESMKITSFSNFFKGEQYYTDLILPRFDRLDKYDRDKLDTYMMVFTKKKTD